MKISWLPHAELLGNSSGKTFPSVLVKLSLTALVSVHLVFQIPSTPDSGVLRTCMLRDLCGQFGEGLMSSGHTFWRAQAPHYKSRKGERFMDSRGEYQIMCFFKVFLVSVY